ncbi:hypothetical protein K435DRAFT_317577 [Dendrothele bispora CBS 962.96]|uniref:Uncharacterized protein n=1 Tax=Dendrothele bispora (strain CBS 962.96) TaxID=1314807 RepID=A0A4S8LGV1_DENBC|nr:hypothetical protein K435DRAFT_317577 [Dendrothele bispora CBS 962.96]
MGPGTGGVSPEELLKQIQSERRMLELERRIMQLERDNLNKERLIFNFEQKLARLQSRSPPGPEPPPDPHAYRSHNDYRNSPSSTPYKHQPPFGSMPIMIAIIMEARLIVHTVLRLIFILTIAIMIITGVRLLDILIHIIIRP